jgi:hypothetical protein
MLAGCLVKIHACHEQAPFNALLPENHASSCVHCHAPHSIHPHSSAASPTIRVALWHQVACSRCGWRTLQVCRVSGLHTQGGAAPVVAGCGNLCQCLSSSHAAPLLWDKHTHRTALCSHTGSLPLIQAVVDVTAEQCTMERAAMQCRCMAQEKDTKKEKEERTDLVGQCTCL